MTAKNRTQRTLKLPSRVTALAFACGLALGGSAQAASNSTIPTPGTNYGTQTPSGTGANIRPEYRSNDSVLNFQAPSAVAPPPANCGAQNLVWTVGGATCNASAGNGLHDQQITLTDGTAPSVGQARFLCSNGTYFQVANSATCMDEVACPAQGVVWNQAGSTCTGTTAPTTSGTSVNVSDSTQPTLGSATYFCGNGTLTLTSSNCVTTPPPSCVAGQALQWNVGGNVCDGVSTAAPSGSNISVSDGTAPTTGNATFNCNSGTFTFVSGTCTVPAPPPAGCAAGTPLSWVSGSSTCNGVSPSNTASGSNAVVSDNTAPTTGSANFLCSNGSYSLVAGSQSCTTAPAPPAPASCPSVSISWTATNGQTCTGLAPGTSSGNTVTALDTTAPNTGSANYICNNGSFSLVNGTQVCNAPAPPPPPPPPAPPPPAPPGPPPANCFMSGWFNTTSLTGPLCGRCGVFPFNHGQTITITSENGLSGQSTQSCNNGVVTITNPSCSTTGPVPANAASGAVFTTDSYGAGGNGQIKSFLCFNVGTEEANLGNLLFRDQNNNVIGSWDNNIESIFIRNTATRFLVWENANFTPGGGFFYDSSAAALGAPVNNGITSIRMVNKP